MKLQLLNLATFNAEFPASPQGFIAYGSGMAITLEGRETIRIGDQQKFVPRL